MLGNLLKVTASKNWDIGFKSRHYGTKMCAPNLSGLS